jgi:hypothetical protein
MHTLWGYPGYPQGKTVEVGREVKSNVSEDVMMLFAM